MSGPKKLDKASAEKLITWLGEKWKSGCPYCHGTHWSTLDYETAVPVFPGQRQYRTVSVVCRTCAAIVTLDAARIGLEGDAPTYPRVRGPE